MRINISNHKFMKNARTFLVTLAVSVLSIGATFAQHPPMGGGTGVSESDPYLITTPAHLADLATFVNGGNGNATNGVYYRLMNDIDLSGYANGYGWNPIGNGSATGPYRFQGNFDGNDKSVKNLTINFPTGNKIGLFGHTYRATIKNLGVENCNITGNDYVGGLVGHPFSITVITNCYTTGKVNGRTYVGGLAGYNESSCRNTDCYSLADVSGSRNYVGGLSGYNSGSTISNSYAKGNVSGSGNFTGGLSGNCYNASTIYNCYATGNVEATGNDVGGLVGSNSSTIYNSYATGNVSASGYSVGGLAGEAGGGTNQLGNRYYAFIQNCYASGSVNGSDNVGGLVGKNFSDSRIYNCVAANEAVIAPSNTANINRIAGSNINGGGGLERNYALATMSVQNSQGHVTITDASMNAGAAKDLNTLQSLDFYASPSNWVSGSWAGGTIRGEWQMSVWDICNGEGLPFLHWQGISCNDVSNIDGNAQNTLLKVYPNPTNDKFVIDFDGVASIKLYDMSGKEVLKQTANGQTEINISHLSQGVYYIQVVSEGKVVGNSKIVKQ